MGKGPHEESCKAIKQRTKATCLFFEMFLKFQKTFFKKFFGGVWGGAPSVPLKESIRKKLYDVIDDLIHQGATEFLLCGSARFPAALPVRLPVQQLHQLLPGLLLQER